ncbi:MAG: hypothetical protein R3E09_16365 [Novosphingobium sp.]
MSIFDSILQQVGSEGGAVREIAEKFGIDPSMAEKAIAALGSAHPEPGNTVESASARTGLDAGVLGQIVEQLGGEGGLGRISEQLRNNPQAAGILDMLDRDGDGNPLDDIADIASGLFGKN